jgi:sugar lactone lactonase YvrE
LYSLLLATPMRGTDVALTPQAQWSVNGTTSAGGHGAGSELTQLIEPYGLYVDDNQTIYVADFWNHRVVAWAVRANQGKVVIGEKPFSQTHWPSDVIIDPTDDSFIICDWRNRQVMRWSRHSYSHGEIIISDISCYGLTMDDRGFLYISDVQKAEVRRWRMNDKQEVIVAGGNGEGDQLNQLNGPSNLFVDRDYSVYVSDSSNHRVMKWTEGAQEGTLVAGGHGPGNRLNQLHYPSGVVVDRIGTVYVSDRSNSRIMRWAQGDTNGTLLAGGNGEGPQMNQLNGAFGLSFDLSGNLYVVDSGNARVQKFELLSL